MRTYRKCRNNFALFISASLLTVLANGASGEDMEGPWVDGVFDTRIITPAQDLTAQKNVPTPTTLADTEGNTNELIILLDYADGTFLRKAVPSIVNGAKGRPEDVLLDAVNGSDTTAHFELGDPTNARYLINTDRLNETRRIYLNKNAPEEQLHRYLVVSYPTISAAQNAERRLKNRPGIVFAGINHMMEYSFAPNDPYFQIKPQPTQYQWGMHTMNFPAAWDKTKGGGYVGIIDSIASISHPDISSVRTQLSFSAAVPSGTSVAYHGRHVTGIIAAVQNNGTGVSGGCPNCSVALAQAAPMASGVTEAIYGLVDRGIQTINMSFGKNGKSCVDYPTICQAITYANNRDVLLVAAAGNYNNTTPDFPANQPSVLSVGGVQSDVNSPTGWATWNYNIANGSSWTGVNGVLAPAKSIVSTATAGSAYNNSAWVMCGDKSGYDESGTNNDGYGSCTGTSMSAPHITALAGILRSINPTNTAGSIKSNIYQSGNLYPSVSSEFGSGLPNAGLAVSLGITLNPRRLTPLFSFYSSGRQDYFYTTSPQMGAAAWLALFVLPTTPRLALANTPLWGCSLASTQTSPAWGAVLV